MKTWLLRLVLLGMVLLLGMWAPVLAVKTPRDLAGKWVDQDGKTYEFRVNGPTVTLLAPNKNGKSDTYIGKFRLNKFDLQFRPTSLETFGNDEIPASIRRMLIGRGHTFEGWIEHDDKADTLKWNRWIDEVTYNPEATKISSVDKHMGVREFTLTRRAGYRIGEVHMDSSHFKARVAKESARLEAEIDRYRKETIPQKEAEIESRVRQLTALEHEIAGKNRQVAAKDQEIRQVQARIAAAAQERNNAKYAALVREKAQLEKAIAALESVRMDYMKSGNTSGSRSLDGQLAPKREELSKVLRELEREFPKNRNVKNLEQQLKKKVAESLALELEASRLSRRYEGNLETLEEAKNTLEEFKLAIASRERQIDYLKRRPIVSRIVFQAGGKPVFIAQADKDEEFLKQYQADIEKLDQELAKLRQKLPQAKQRVAEAKAEQKKIRVEVNKARQQLNIRNSELYNLMMSNRWWRAGVELGGNAIDVVLAFKDGGIAGSFAELGQKMAEWYWLQDGQSFQMFDESALKKQMYGETPAPDWSDPTKFAVEQAKKTPLTLLKTGGLQVYERAGLQAKERAARGALASARDRVQSSFVSRQKEEAVRALEKAAAERGRARDMLKDAMRQRTAGAKFGLDSFKDNIAQSRKRERLALDSLLEAADKRTKAFGAMRQGISRLRKAQDKMTKFVAETSGKGGLKNLARGIGSGLAVDGIKAALSSRFDRQEEEAWMNYFQADLTVKAYTDLHHKASNFYWNCFDVQKDLEETIQVLEILRQQAEQDREAYLASAREGNFYIEKNDGFEKDASPLIIELTLVGPDSREQVFLEKAEGPPANGNYKPAEGLPLRERPGTDLDTKATLDRRAHYYQFIPDRLPRLQSSGQLPLRIFQH